MEHRSPEERRRTHHPVWKRSPEQGNWQQLLSDHYLGRYASLEAFASLFIKENRLMERVEPMWLRPFIRLDLAGLASLLTEGLIVIPDPEGGVHLFEDPETDSDAESL